MSSAPQTTRARHELERRRFSVVRAERLAPGMVRVVLGGKDPRGLTPVGFDEHVKLFLLDDAGAVAMRDFAPRRFDAAAGELWIDFYLHEAGPAASWPAQAVTGQSLEEIGPKGSAAVTPRGIEVHVFLGDGAASPAIGRRLGELPDGAHSLVVVEVDDIGQWCACELSKARPIVWVTRGTLPETPV